MDRPRANECERASTVIDLLVAAGFVSAAKVEEAKKLAAEIDAVLPDGDQEALSQRAATLIDSYPDVHPEGMSHDDAGTLWVWSQDALGLLRQLVADPRALDGAEASSGEQGAA